MMMKKQIILGLLLSSALSHNVIAGELLPGEITLPPCVGTAPICYGQIHSENITNGSWSYLIPKMSFVWAANNPTNPAPVLNTIFGAEWTTLYNSTNSGWNNYYLTWFQTNHPDWVLYQSNTTYPAYHGAVYRSITNAIQGASNGMGGYLFRIVTGNDGTIFNATFNGTISGNTLTVTSGLSGIIAVNTQVTCGGCTYTTFNILTGSGSTWTIDGNPQTVSSPTAMASNTLVSISGATGATGINTPATAVNVIDKSDFDLPGTTYSPGYITDSGNASWGGNVNVVPLDFQNPLVQQFILNYMTTPVNSTNGYTHIDFDVATSQNTGFAVGHWIGTPTSSCVGTPNTCGMTWHPDFSGSGQDPVYQEDIINFVRNMTTNFHALGVYDIGNVGDVGLVKTPANPTSLTAGYQQQQGAAFDINLLEGAFINCKYPPCKKIADLNFLYTYNSTLTLGREQGNEMIAYLLTTVGAPQSEPSDQAWAEATYLLLKDDPNGPPTYFSPIGCLACTLAVPSFTGVLSGNTLTASSVTGVIGVGYNLVGSGVNTTTVTKQLTGPTGGAGTYTFSGPTQSISSEAMTADPSNNGYYVEKDPTWYPPIGNPVGLPYQLPQANGLYSFERQFTNGIIEINASSTLPSYYTLASGSYWDAACNSISSGTNWLAPDLPSQVSASFTGSLSGNTLTASNVVGFIPLGTVIYGSGVTPATITAYVTGTGGNGTYKFDGSTQSVASEAMTATTASNASFTGVISTNTLTVTSSSGFVAIPSAISGSGVTPAWIISQTSGTPNGNGAYVISGPGQTISSEAMTSSNAHNANGIIIVKTKPSYCP